jgi:hypothetical protein
MKGWDLNEGETERTNLCEKLCEKLEKSTRRKAFEVKAFLKTERCF